MQIPLAQLAERQHGVFSTRQAADLGIPKQRLVELRERSVIVPVHRGVHRIAGAPLGYESELMIAVLVGGPSTVVSHRAAARLWRIGRVPPGEPEVISSRWRRLKALGITAHESSLLNGHDTTTLEGFPVVTPLRCIFLLGAVTDRHTVAQALDDALDRSLLTLDGVRRELSRLGQRGRNGVTAVRRALELKEFAPGTSESALEQRFLDLLLRAGLPAPVRQHRVKTIRGEFRLDFAYPDHMLAIELDGRSFHDRSEAFQRDRTRQNLLVAEGWKLLRFTWDDVIKQPGSVARTVEEVAGPSLRTN